MGKTYKKQRDLNVAKSYKREIDMQEKHVPCKKVYKRKAKYGNSNYTAEQSQRRNDRRPKSTSVRRLSRRRAIPRPLMGFGRTLQAFEKETLK